MRPACAKYATMRMGRTGERHGEVCVKLYLAWVWLAPLGPIRIAKRVSGGRQCGSEVYMLWTIFVIILALWILGFSFHVAGGLIHLLLVVGLAILIFNLVTRRRSVL